MPPFVLESTVPGYWYWMVLPVVATLLYFLLTRPRKREGERRWRG